MPIYAYQCVTCTIDIDTLQKINAPAPQCPKCQQTMHKKVTAAGFQFKGTGYYVTDFRDPPVNNKKDEGGKSTTPPDSAHKKSDTNAASTPKTSATAKSSSPASN